MAMEPASSLGGFPGLSLSLSRAVLTHDDSSEATSTPPRVKREPYNEDSYFHDLPITRHIGDSPPNSPPNFAECQSDSTSREDARQVSIVRPGPEYRTDERASKPLTMYARVNGRGEPYGDSESASIIDVLKTVVHKHVHYKTMWSKVTREVKYSIYRELQTKVAGGESISPDWILKKGRAIHSNTQSRAMRKIFHVFRLSPDSVHRALDY